MTTFNDKNLYNPLVINKLTQSQLQNATEIREDQLYAVDMQFKGNGIVTTTANGDLQEGYTQVSFADAATITLLNNAIYNASAAISTLNITLPTTANADFIAEIVFTNNATSSAVITPSATIKWVGDDCDEDYTFTPLVNYRYTIFITYDGLNWIGNVRGVK